MLSFKLFLEEVKEQYLYHNTSFLGLKSIFELGGIGARSGFNNKTAKWEKLEKGYVSFTRNKLYQMAPGTHSKPEVRLVFKYDTLKRKYKIKPYADLSVVKRLNTDDLDSYVKSHESRWESEEKVLGPVDIKLVEKIEIVKSAYEEQMKWVDIWKKELDHIQERKEKLKDGIFWHYLNKKYEKLSDFPKVNVVSQEKGLESEEKRTQKMVDDVETIFKNPKVKIIERIS